MLRRVWLVALGWFVVWCGSAEGLELEGVAVPASKVVDGKRLVLNGAGVRTLNLAFIAEKVYVASFYSAKRLRTADEVMGYEGPMQLNFTFLRDVSGRQVAEAWRRQIAASVTEVYDSFARDRETFISFFPALSRGDTQTVELLGGKTRARLNGRELGVVVGRDFQRSFLSMWFGRRAVQRELKQALLGQGRQ